VKLNNIDEKIKKLYEKVPDKWLKRNHRAYNYICALNLVIVLYLANNLQQHIIQRCYKELEIVKKQNEGSEFVELSVELLQVLNQKIQE
jgi:ABC-type Zn uptake system ZnuABC Zn-binding protein ZnuA